MVQATQFLPFLLSVELMIPLSSQNQDFQAARFETSDGSMMLAFSSPLALADFFEGDHTFTEMAPQAVLAMALESELLIGFDLGQPHGVILNDELLSNLLDFLKNREKTLEIQSLDLRSFSPDFALMEELSENLPRHLDVWLLQDQCAGELLFIGMDEEDFGLEDQFMLRHALLKVQHCEQMGLFILPKEHSKYKELLQKVQKFGHRIEPRNEIADPKPPILK